MLYDLYVLTATRQVKQRILVIRVTAKVYILNNLCTVCEVKENLTLAMTGE